VKREFHFDLYTLASSKLQVTGDVSPGPNLPKEKEPPHCGDIGWGRKSTPPVSSSIFVTLEEYNEECCLMKCHSKHI
jgi:hypothetical protein